MHSSNHSAASQLFLPPFSPEPEPISSAHSRPATPPAAISELSSLSVITTGHSFRPPTRFWNSKTEPVPSRALPRPVASLAWDIEHRPSLIHICLLSLSLSTIGFNQLSNSLYSQPPHLQSNLFGHPHRHKLHSNSTMPLSSVSTATQAV
ncbi:hypothetical protein M0R45_007365 [Rubus argutus]|uniref:Uncharacterized protein n=1 Tax=Rubus argutus TaxID=59490 RepID=A0AAW1XZL2_RUBAR